MESGEQYTYLTTKINFKIIILQQKTGFNSIVSP
jgi:hypothetical protein